MEVHTSFVKIPKAERDSIYLLMTGFCGLSGTAMIAKKKGDDLTTGKSYSAGAHRVTRQHLFKVG